jgi:hypothetical protein
MFIRIQSNGVGGLVREFDWATLFTLQFWFHDAVL